MSLRGLHKDRSLLIFVGLFALIWIAYAIAMATRPDNAFSPFHNDTFWPAEQYMTVAQAGLFLPIFGHLMITFVGGAFLTIAVVGLLTLVKKAGGPDFATYAPLPIFGLLYVYGFLLVRGVPHIVTVIDSSAHTLSVRSFAGLSLLPQDYEAIQGADLVAIGVKTMTGHRTHHLVTRVYVSRRDGERLPIGSLECMSRDTTECLDSAYTGVTALVKALGRGIESQAKSADGRTRAYTLAPVQ